MRIAKACLAAVAIALTACGDGNHGDARIVVTEQHQEPKGAGVYIEGAVQFVELTESGEQDHAIKLRLEGTPATRKLDSGDYRVVSYTRTCSAACSTHLDQPSLRCTASLSIGRGETRKLLVTTVVGRRCTIHGT